MCENWTREMCIAHLVLRGARMVRAVVGRSGIHYAVLIGSTLYYRAPLSRYEVSISTITPFVGKTSDAMHLIEQRFATDVLRAICEKEMNNAVE